ncbi:hypothetical protein C8Q76DRAFT_741905 [Earliella scabrosa]|nr:hypothetical protein C8Q76DRAFT_741905 [Earliella scabrosa]
MKWSMPPNHAVSMSSQPAQVKTPHVRELLQRPYESRRRFSQKPAISFRTTNGLNYVRLEDALNGRLTCLEGAEDEVFSGDADLSQKQSLRLEIIGPECRPWERQINVRNPANRTRSVTRARLAEKVAKEIYDYMKRLTGSLGEPALGLGPELRGFERLVLFELRHVSTSSWQPILGLLP